MFYSFILFIRSKASDIQAALIGSLSVFIWIYEHVPHEFVCTDPYVGVCVYVCVCKVSKFVALSQTAFYSVLKTGWL